MRKSLSFAAAALSGLLTVSTVSAQNQPTVQTRSATDQLQSGKQSSTTVKQAIAKKLMMANKAEIELAQLAQQKSKNEQVSQLAETLINDHRELNEKLKQWAPSDTNPAGRNTGAQRETQATTAQPGQNQQANVKGGSSPTVPQALCKIMDQASSNALTMTKDMLQEYEGEEFDMAFVGQQTIAHMMLLAELKAIQSQNLDQISQIAGQAATTTEQHLQEFKRLAKELKDNSDKS